MKKGGVAVLDNFLEKLGYGYWDDERLAARLVMHAEQILDPGLDVDVIEEMRRFTETLEYLRQFRAVDARTGKPRKRKSLGSYIREVLKKDGRGLSPKVVWQILEAKGVVRENETGATAWKGGVVRWESFCNAVYRERKKLKNLEN
ncbi:hypothetical protein [Luteithermobacter gelatinilyticus]|uniref:hypothetical protein n=1 Tax=Luteithermobacter gelatinilyticus TaxID=2582913 RepID=UPI00110676C6|nr:hypothetical protein [Luteithermobacter gelatinilyticus]